MIHFTLGNLEIEKTRVKSNSVLYNAKIFTVFFKSKAHNLKILRT